MSVAQPAPTSSPTTTTTTGSRAARVAGRLTPPVRLALAPRPLRRAPRVPFVALVGSLLLAGVVGLLLFNTSMQQNSFTASALESRAASLEARQQTLQMEIEELRDPQRVARQARRLGMVAAGSPAFLDISDGSVLGDPEVAAADGLRIEAPAAVVPEALVPERVVVVDKSLIERAASRREGRAGGTTDSGAVGADSTDSTNSTGSADGQGQDIDE